MMKNGIVCEVLKNPTKSALPVFLTSTSSRGRGKPGAGWRMTVALGGVVIAKKGRDAETETVTEELGAPAVPQGATVVTRCAYDVSSEALRRSEVSVVVKVSTNESESLVRATR